MARPTSNNVPQRSPGMVRGLIVVCFAGCILFSQTWLVMRKNAREKSNLKLVEKREELQQQLDTLSARIRERNERDSLERVEVTHGLELQPIPPGNTVTVPLSLANLSEAAAK